MPKISPWLSVIDAAKASEFYEAAFGATVLQRLEVRDGVPNVVQLAMGDADFWVQTDPDSAPGPLHGKSPAHLILTVDDPDAVFEAALSAGATVVYAMKDGYGWRIGRLTDPSGYEWEIGKPLS